MNDQKTNDQNQPSSNRTENDFNYDTMTQADFEERLPEIFATHTTGKVSDDPRLQTFLADHPDAASLVRDLETIAEHARSLFEPVHEPSEDLWAKIQSRLTEPGDPDAIEPGPVEGQP
jgi:hypothetical protein